MIILEYNASFKRFDKIYTFLNSLYKSQCTKMLSDISPSLFRQKLLLYMASLIPLIFRLLSTFYYVFLSFVSQKKNSLEKFATLDLSSIPIYMYLTHNLITRHPILMIRVYNLLFQFKVWTRKKFKKEKILS